MKVLLVGYHNPNFMNTIILRQKAIKDLGHRVIPFNDAGYIVPGRIRSRFSWVQQWDLKRLNKCLVNLVKKQKPDVCLIVGGQNILPQTVADIKVMHIPIGLWTTDVPLDFNNILDAAKFYDHLFCAGTEAMDIFTSKGFNHATWVPFACDPHLHQRISLTESQQRQYARDLIFIGSYYPNRARVLESIADLDIAVWGPYWEKLATESPLKGKAKSIKLNYDIWVKIFNASKINIVIHYQDGKVPCHQVSPKLFEAMACGCFVLTDDQKDVCQLFNDKEHLVVFHNEDDLRQKIEYYLKHDDERQCIALAGHELVVAQHTYEQRIKQILGILLK